MIPENWQPNNPQQKISHITAPELLAMLDQNSISSFENGAIIMEFFIFTIEFWTIYEDLLL